MFSSDIKATIACFLVVGVSLAAEDSRGAFLSAPGRPTPPAEPNQITTPMVYTATGCLLRYGGRFVLYAGGALLIELQGSKLSKNIGNRVEITGVQAEKPELDTARLTTGGAGAGAAGAGEAGSIMEVVSVNVEALRLLHKGGCASSAKALDAAGSAAGAAGAGAGAGAATGISAATIGVIVGASAVAAATVLIIVKRKHK